MGWENGVYKNRDVSATGQVDPSDEEIKEILDDPNVPVETKRELIAAWAYDYGTGPTMDGSYAPYHTDNIPDEVKRYADKYDAHDEIDAYRKDADAQNTRANAVGGPRPKSPPTDARNLVDRGKDEREHADTKEQHEKDGQELDRFRDGLATSGTTGAETSKEIFDAGATGLEFFRIFLPRYNAHTGQGNAALDLVGINAEVAYGKPYDQQREVDFAAIKHDIELLRAASEQLADQVADLTNRKRTLSSSWRGDAAESAKLAFDRLLRSAQTVRRQLDGVRECLETVLPVLEELCVIKADAIHQLFAVTIGGVTAPVIDLMIKASKQAASDDELQRLADELGIQPDYTYCESYPEELRAEAARSAQQWLDTNLVPVFETKHEAFTGVCEAVHEGFTDALEALSEITSSIDVIPRADSGVTASTPGN